MMTYEEVMEFALKHYNEGGDSTYECLSEYEYNKNIADGIVYNEENLLKDFALDLEIWNEMQATIF